jgi:uncharacterized protein YndB with AHSA1/START domain
MSRLISTTATAEVAAPFAQVWDLVSDLAGYAAWVHGTVEVLDADPQARVGATYTERNRVLGPVTARSVWTVAVVDEARGHQRHETPGVPGVRPFAVILQLTPTATGTGTQVELRLEAAVAAGLLTRPLAWMFGRSLPPSNERTLRALVELAEAPVGAAARR